MSKKLLLAAGVTSVLFLAGCSGSPDPTAEKIDNLTNQVEMLTKEVQSLKSGQTQATMQAKEAAGAAMAAREEAERANDRIDNIAQSYKK